MRSSLGPSTVHRPPSPLPPLPLPLPLPLLPPLLLLLLLLPLPLPLTLPRGCGRTRGADGRQGKVRRDSEMIFDVCTIPKATGRPVRMMLRLGARSVLEKAGATVLSRTTEQIAALEAAVAATQKKLSHNMFDRALVTLRMSELEDMLRRLQGSMAEARINHSLQLQKENADGRLESLMKEIERIRRFVHGIR